MAVTTRSKKKQQKASKRKRSTPVSTSSSTSGLSARAQRALRRDQQRGYYSQPNHDAQVVDAAAQLAAYHMDTNQSVGRAVSAAIDAHEKRKKRDQATPFSPIMEFGRGIQNAFKAMSLLRHIPMILMSLFYLAIVGVYVLGSYFLYEYVQGTYTSWSDWWTSGTRPPPPVEEDPVVQGRASSSACRFGIMGCALVLVTIAFILKERLALGRAGARWFTGKLYVFAFLVFMGIASLTAMTVISFAGCSSGSVKFCFVVAMVWVFCAVVMVIAYSAEAKDDQDVRDINAIRRKAAGKVVGRVGGALSAARSTSVLVFAVQTIMAIGTYVYFCVLKSSPLDFRNKDDLLFGNPEPVPAYAWIVAFVPLLLSFGPLYTYFKSSREKKISDRILRVGSFLNKSGASEEEERENSRIIRAALGEESTLTKRQKESFLREVEMNMREKLEEIKRSGLLKEHPRIMKLLSNRVTDTVRAYMAHVGVGSDVKSREALKTMALHRDVKRRIRLLHTLHQSAGFDDVHEKLAYTQEMNRLADMSESLTKEEEAFGKSTEILMKSLIALFMSITVLAILSRAVYGAKNPLFIGESTVEAVVGNIATLLDAGESRLASLFSSDDVSHNFVEQIMVKMGVMRQPEGERIASEVMSYSKTFLGSVMIWAVIKRLVYDPTRSIIQEKRDVSDARKEVLGPDP